MTGFAVETSWGPYVRAGGATRFRLWAPTQDKVSLLAEGATESSGRHFPMEKAADGWFALETDAIGVGDAYRFALSNGMRVPDPAARAQVDTVHGASRLFDPRAFRWACGDWKGRPWEEAILYELHTGTFTPQGDFDGVRSRLDHLARLGITAIEIMPVAQFSGRRGWGYDGVLLYAPHAAYGGPEGLKRLVDAAHERGIMVLLDVVYNHFGPDGNYLHVYAPQFFRADLATPWGPAIAYDKTPVREFFIDNALYWLEEFQLDGLRLDAINHIEDNSDVSLLEALALRVRERITGRHIHLTTEDDRNIVRLHRREQGRATLYTAEWNDDFHHAAHVIATGESEAYYGDYDTPVDKLGKAVAEGFVYQGQGSPFWGGATRGEPSVGQPTVAFIDFLQNHDQIGNRAFGERLTSLAREGTIDLLSAVLLLSPHIPMLFMGEEWAERHPFYFFTDFEGELAKGVREGRRHEFAKWAAFADPLRRELIPDPNALSTFQESALNWPASGEAQSERRFALIRGLIEVRKQHIVPRLKGLVGSDATRQSLGREAFEVRWRLARETLTLRANFGAEPAPCAKLDPRGTIYMSGSEVSPTSGLLPAQSVLAHIAPRDAA